MIRPTCALFSRHTANRGTHEDGNVPHFSLQSLSPNLMVVIPNSFEWPDLRCPPLGTAMNPEAIERFTH